MRHIMKVYFNDSVKSWNYNGMRMRCLAGSVRPGGMKAPGTPRFSLRNPSICG